MLLPPLTMTMAVRSQTPAKASHSYQAGSGGGMGVGDVIDVVDRVDGIGKMARMKSLLIFSLAFLLWFFALGSFEKAPMLSLTFTGIGGVVCLVGLFVNHGEHTRRR